MRKTSLKILVLFIVINVLWIITTRITYATSTRNTVTNVITEERVKEIVDEKVENAVNGAINGNEASNTANTDLSNSEGQAKSKGIGMLAAAIATGLACIGSGIAVAVVASSAVGAISENPSLLGKTIIFAGLAEGIAIYGLIISIMILNKI